MSWLRRKPKPIQHPTFGRLEWRKLRRVGYWDGRVVFPPTGAEIDIAIPGGRSGPDSAETLWARICEVFPKIQADVDAQAAREGAQSQIVIGILRLERLIFFDTSVTQGAWKFIYRTGQTEVHADGEVQQIDSVFVVDQPHAVLILE